VKRVTRSGPRQGFSLLLVCYLVLAVQQLRSTIAMRMEGEKIGQMGALMCIMQRPEDPKW
jgi:hypothetical protein